MSGMSCACTVVVITAPVTSIQIYALSARSPSLLPDSCDISREWSLDMTESAPHEKHISPPALRRFRNQMSLLLPSRSLYIQTSVIRQTLGLKAPRAIPVPMARGIDAKSHVLVSSGVILPEGKGLHGLFVVSSMMAALGRWLDKFSTSKLIQIQTSTRGIRFASSDVDKGVRSNKFAADRAPAIANILWGKMTVLKSLFVKRNSVLRS